MMQDFHVSLADVAIVVAILSITFSGIAMLLRIVVQSINKSLDLFDKTIKTQQELSKDTNTNFIAEIKQGRLDTKDFWDDVKIINKTFIQYIGENTNQIKALNIVAKELQSAQTNNLEKLRGISEQSEQALEALEAVLNTQQETKNTLRQILGLSEAVKEQFDGFNQKAIKVFELWSEDGKLTEHNANVTHTLSELSTIKRDIMIAIETIQAQILDFTNS